MHRNFNLACRRVLGESRLIDNQNSQAASYVLDAVIEWGKQLMMKSSKVPSCPATGEAFSASTGSAISNAEKLHEVLAPLLAAIQFESEPILDLMEEREDVFSLLPLQRLLAVRIYLG